MSDENPVENYAQIFPNALGAETPTDQIVNPYREAMAAQTQPGRVYHPEAEGLTGEAIDKLMMSRFTEGVGRGRQEAFIECQPKIATAFDQGALAGQAAGFAHGRETLLQEIGIALGMALGALDSVVKRSGSKELKGRAAEAADALRERLAQI